MKSFMWLLMLSLLAVPYVGCAREESIKKETTVTTPDGKTKITEEKTVERSGERPPQ